MMIYSIPGIIDVDNQIMSQRASEVWAWLKAGFGRVASEEVGQRRSAFPPLDLAPDRDLLGQLGTAMREAEHAGLSSPDQLRDVARDMVGKPLVFSKEDRRDLISAWRLLGALGCSPEICADARAFLKQLLRSQADTIVSEEEKWSQREIVDAVVGCIAASSPGSGSQVAFMRFLRGQKNLWSARYVEVFLDCVFAELKTSRTFRNYESERRKEAWCDLRAELSEEFGERADPETVAGRSLLRSIARYVGLPVEPTSEPRNSSILRTRLWQMNVVGDRPTVSFHRAETLEGAFP